MAAVIGNATALNAVVTSSVAMAAIAGSGKARVAITNSSVAFGCFGFQSAEKERKVPVHTTVIMSKIGTNGPALSSLRLIIILVGHSVCAMCTLRKLHPEPRRILQQSVHRASICSLHLPV